MLEKLRELGIRDELIREITEYRETYPVEQEYGSRIPKLEQFYYGKEVWENKDKYSEARYAGKMDAYRDIFDMMKKMKLE